MMPPIAMNPPHRTPRSPLVVLRQPLQLLSMNANAKNEMELRMENVNVCLVCNAVAAPRAATEWPTQIKQCPDQMRCVNVAISCLRFRMEFISGIEFYFCSHLQINTCGTHARTANWLATVNVIESVAVQPSNKECFNNFAQPERKESIRICSFNVHIRH